MSEESEIKRMGGRPVKNSGRSQSTAKGDAILEPFLVDVKEYDKSFSVSRENWAKLCGDAMLNGRRAPSFLLVLGEDGKTPIRVWCVDDGMFHEMREAWLEKYEH